MTQILSVMEDASDEYGKAPYELHPEPYRSGYIARRTGITMPGWIARAVYCLEDEYYVYEDGKLVPSDKWHERTAMCGVGT